MNEDYLAHYGIKGQKWGVRRYQNSDGTWTAEGRARYGSSGDKLSRKDKKEIKAEYKADNQKAYELGRKATISARAAGIAEKQEAKAQKRYDKKQTAKRKAELETAKALRKDWDKTAEQNRKLAEAHYQELAKKYGSEHVKGIKYDKKGRVNEKTHTGGDYASSLGKSFGTAALANLLGSPVTAVWYPSGKNVEARSAYDFSKRAKSAEAGMNLAAENVPVIQKTYNQRRMERDARAYRREYGGRHARY